MEISFCDDQLCAVFNSYRLLRKVYGQELAHSIALRMGVLSAAPSLVAVPRKPPIRLRDEKGTYTVNLAKSRRLRFQSLQNADGTAVDIEQITAIQILGLDQ
ncbi:hypothetical protein EOA27_05660 [Mesorhizobium sp. M2A.F.Ca.ET.037.01.1.1]|uniref:hypothetical protein n=1 Tax=unclassified Mesorhizobium TaxID=325217 RepID=UPI000FCBAA8A|nr:MULTISPECIES: hypothetical protein [unclassified Mesorhizobium]RUX21593.1 hypothetical protein EOA27_05660 [Mesorhizobium sp. M2A.F.Ca.ET.037.01.1.1]RUY12060.1 hypothetical protein EOA25_04350 [Mesorhizobium sp. M2A.F.Ca.ET.040.01.1.1]RWA91642.1 MAG: hypothetical protein EOQ31_11045 [Mesorhizobium sp.]TIV14483.1 MAG: hypothetical protein E5V95_30155 [Mesorhizobium sp.]